MCAYQISQCLYDITKTCLYNIDPLKPHFYIVKLGFTGIYIIFLISAQNIDYEYLLEPPRRGGSNEYHNLCFEQKYEKYQSFLSENFQFLEVKVSIYLNRRVYVMSIGCLVAKHCIKYCIKYWNSQIASWLHDIYTGIVKSPLGYIIFTLE